MLGQFALMGLAVAAPGQLAPLIYVPGVALLGGGLGMMIWGSESLGSSLSPLPKPRKHGELVTDGAYAVVR